MEDRQVSLKQMLDTVDEMPVMKDNNGMEFIEKSLVKTRLWLLPSAEPTQKTGKWIYKTTDAYIQRTCSACGWSERMYHCNHNQDGLIRNYCPNCGAKMEREKITKRNNKYHKKMSKEQKEFFRKAGDLKTASIMNKIEFNTELVRTEGIPGVLDPLPNADWPLYKDSKIPW